MIMSPRAEASWIWLRSTLRHASLVPAGAVRALLILTLSNLLCAQDGSATRPNILFFLTDDQRHDQLGGAGHPILETPVIDGLARRGVRFTNCFVTTPICAASRATILTGLHERTHGYTFGTPPISARDVAGSYPARLRAAGYRTGFVGKWGVRMEKGQRDRLFDRFVPLTRTPYVKKLPDGTRRHVTDITGDHTVSFLREQTGEKPFCLSVSFNAPHAEDGNKRDHFPFPNSVARLYDDLEMPWPRLRAREVFERQPEFLRTSMNRDRWFWRWDEPEKYQRNYRNYLRMISGIDTCIGRVLAELKRLDLHRSTIVVFSSDNGFYLGDRGFAGKWSHYDQALRVPLVIHDPRLPAEERGRLVHQLVVNADLAPTFLDLAGVPAEKRHQGRSLVALLGAEPVRSWREEVFCEHLFRHRSIPRWEGVRGRRFTYARYVDQDPVHEFLHDLEVDPDQLVNLATSKEHAKQLAAARQRCSALRDRYEAAQAR